MGNIRRVTVIVNPLSGPKREGIPLEAVRDALRAAGIAEAEVVPLARGLDLKQVVAACARTGADAVIAAGGDGTVSAVASALANTELPLGILPAGTLNHFARDVGIPAELESAARVIAEGRSVRVDVARVNGRIFINNSSIGLYPAIVNARDRFMCKGVPKRVAASAGAMAALWEFPNTTVRVTSGRAGLVTRTPFVFVGNNSYQLSGLEAGTRDGLHGGLLQICTVRSPDRAALLRTVALALVGTANATPDLYIVSAEEAQIVTLRRTVRVAVDGEVILMNSPLDYSICPAALRVLAPGES